MRGPGRWENLSGGSARLTIECSYSHNSVAETVLRRPTASAFVADNADNAPEFLPKNTDHHIVDRLLPAVWMAGPAHSLLRGRLKVITRFVEQRV